MAIKEVFIIAVAFGYAFVGIVTACVMLELLGRPGKSKNPETKRSLHRWLGWIFAAATLVFLGLMMPKAAWHATHNEPYPIRIFTHAFLGLMLVPLLAIKLAIAKRYVAFRSSFPVLGIAIAVTALMVIILSAGHGFLEIIGN